MNASYTFTRRHAPTTRNSITMPRMKAAPVVPAIRAACSAGKRARAATAATNTPPTSSTGTSNFARQIGRRWHTATAITPASSEMKVTIRVGRKMSAALKFAPRPCFNATLWRIAITEVGIKVSPAVFITTNMICALLAASGPSLLSVFSDCSSRIALSPSGVAALSSPSRLAEMFMVIAPCAGCPLGTPGKSRVSNGLATRASSSIIPAFSPTRIRPSHSAMIPARPSEISKPERAPSNIAVSNA